MFSALKRFSVVLLFLFPLGFLVSQEVGSSDQLKNDEYRAPALLQEGNWTIALIPDTQTYTKYSRNHGILELITGWLCENKQTLNIGLLMCVGDLVESNGVLCGDGFYCNQNAVQMWKAISHAFARFDGVYPYVLCTGNHDYGGEFMPDGKHFGIHSSDTRETKFKDFFPVERNPLWRDSLIECAPNFYGHRTLENAAYEITAPNGRKLLVVSLEFLPRDEILVWAKEIFDRPEYQNHLGIVLTHSYMLPKGLGLDRIGKERYALSETGNSGQAIWEKLIAPTPNIRLVFCGHACEPSFSESCGFRVDENCTGKKVYQFIFDTQALGGGWEGNGGDGWIQFIEFSADMTKINVRTFSPLFAISPSTQHMAWSHEDYCEYEIIFEE